MSPLVTFSNIEVDVDVDVEVWCSCGVGLCRQSEAYGKGLMVEPCQDCLRKAENMGYDKGYKDGLEEGRDEIRDRE